MRLSPLSLKNYYTTSFAFSADPQFEVSEGSYSIDIEDLKVEVEELQNDDNPLDRACQILVQLGETTVGKYPYDFSITLVGFFEVSSAWDVSKIDVLFSSNAPALLYSAARHALATATGTGPHNKIVLPSVSFVKLQEPDQTNTESKKPPQKKKVIRQKKTE